MAEAADLVVDALDLLGHGGGRADEPVVLGAIGRRHVRVGHLRAVLQIVEEPEIGEERQEVLVHHPAHHAAHREAPRLLVGLGDEDLADHAPDRAVGRAPAALGADWTDSQWLPT